MKPTSINSIAEELKSGAYSSNPHGAADALYFLSGEYSFIAGQLETILVNKPAMWNLMRTKVESDKAAEKLWEASVSGMDETGLKIREKNVRQLMSSLKTLLRLAENQYKNL